MKEIIKRLKSNIEETEEDECPTVSMSVPFAYSILRALEGELLKDEKCSCESARFSRNTDTNFKPLCGECGRVIKG